jgi:acetolactate synthase-1/2/3 large subunit
VRKWLTGRDVVLAVGTELAESDLWSQPPALDGTLIRVDIDADQMYAGAATDIALVGDADASLKALLSEMRDHARVAADTDAVRAARDAETAERDARWIPYLRAIRSVLADDAVITSDSAQCCYYGALPHLPLGPAGRYLHPTGFGTLGYALPAAIGAKVACPDRQVVALSGDGGLQFTVQELATAAQLRLPLPVVVFDNGGYAEIRDEMTARGDSPTAVDLAPVDLPALARAYGGHGTRTCHPDELAAALTEALRTPGPTLIAVPEETP